MNPKELDVHLELSELNVPESEASRKAIRDEFVTLLARIENMQMQIKSLRYQNSQLNSLFLLAAIDRDRYAAGEQKLKEELGAINRAIEAWKKEDHSSVSLQTLDSHGPIDCFHAGVQTARDELTLLIQFPPAEVPKP